MTFQQDELPVNYDCVFLFFFFFEMRDDLSGDLRWIKKNATENGVGYLLPNSADAMIKNTNTLRSRSSTLLSLTALRRKGKKIDWNEQNLWTVSTKPRGKQQHRASLVFDGI